MVNEIETKLFLVFVMFVMLSSLTSVIFGAYLPKLVNQVNGQPEYNKVNVYESTVAVFKIATFTAENNEPVLSIIFDAMNLIGIYLIIAFIFNR